MASVLVSKGEESIATSERSWLNCSQNDFQRRDYRMKKQPTALNEREKGKVCLVYLPSRLTVLSV